MSRESCMVCQMTVTRDADARPRQPDGLRCTYTRKSRGRREECEYSLDTFLVEFDWSLISRNSAASWTPGRPCRLTLLIMMQGFWRHGRKYGRHEVLQKTLQLLNRKIDLDKPNPSFDCSSFLISNFCKFNTWPNSEPSDNFELWTVSYFSFFWRSFLSHDDQYAPRTEGAHDFLLTIVKFGNLSSLQRRIS